MAYNNSTESTGAPIPTKVLNYRMLLSFSFSAFFLYINGLLLASFFKKEVFRKSMRYILFAHTLMSDSMYLFLANVLAVLDFFHIYFDMFLCIPMLTVAHANTFVFPVTLTAMTLERYVAICMPMQHATLSTQRNALHCIVVITFIGCIPIAISLFTYWALLPQYVYVAKVRCSIERLLLHRWQSHLDSAVNQFYFLIMLIIVVFCYVQITKAARKASGESKKSSGKGLRTVLLHGAQLFLCLLRFWCPFVEQSLIQIDFMLYINVRYANFIILVVAPRCLSSLVYGLRDRKLFLMLKYYAACGFFYKSPPAIND